MSKPRAPRILVVDDSEAGLLLVSSVLQLAGFLVDTAGSSQEVLRQLKVRMPDLILMDVQLPGQDGLDQPLRYGIGEAAVNLLVVKPVLGPKYRTCMRDVT